MYNKNQENFIRYTSGVLGMLQIYSSKEKFL